ncbi:MAG TPA: SMP-30/gluconolactonase/LRE family protein [Gemmataceae bacterium]|jgi:gluconolactonase|nr:SMP-30/gluconolactonase/LRE family protein [Gemmataceae bacterium]
MTLSRITMLLVVLVLWPSVIDRRLRISAAEPEKYATMGSIDRADPRLDALIPASAKLERLADGFDWAEGPVWVPSGKYLLFDDIPKNTTFKWKEGEGVSVYLKPSGYSGTAKFTGREPGANGLTLDREGRLLLCQHGDRRVVRQEKDGKLTVIADRYEGKRFNSPNDIVVKSNGDIYFTDPPYGLPKVDNDPARELDFCGVYRVSPKTGVTLLSKELDHPNGLAFSPDEKTLYVANSGRTKPIVMAYDVKPDGTLGAGRLFFDAGPLQRTGKPGAPDGMKVDVRGNLWTTGPGGVLVLTPDGTHLGTIETGEPTANCNWGDDGSTLYITANKYLCRIRTTTKGNGF